MQSVPESSSDSAHQLVAGVLAGADDQPAGERVGADAEEVFAGGVEVVAVAMGRTGLMTNVQCAKE